MTISHFFPFFSINVHVQMHLINPQCQGGFNELQKHIWFYKSNQIVIKQFLQLQPCQGMEIIVLYTVRYSPIFSLWVTIQLGEVQCMVFCDK